MQNVRKKKGQVWSFDILLAAGLFILGFVIFMYVISLDTESERVAKLKYEADVISQKIVSTGYNIDNDAVFVINNKVDRTRFKNLSAIDYDELKSRLGVENDFCIYVVDEQGKIINITGNSTFGIGDPDAKIDGIPCGKI